MQARHEGFFVFKTLLIAGLSLSVVCLMSGCSSVTVGDPSNFTAISIATSTLRVNETAQLSAHTQFDGTALAFYVNGVLGGKVEVGTISSGGLYTAPAIVPVPNSVTITSASAAHPDYPKGSLTLAVWNPIPVIDTVTPSGFSEGDTQVAVTGSRFVYGAQVMWNGKAVDTTYVSSTHLEAVIPAPNPGTFPLLVSNPNPGSANSKTLQVKVAPGQVKLRLEAWNGTDVRVRNSLSLGLEVMGTNNKGVTLAVNGIGGGESTVGTAVSNADGSITYRAPALVPTPNVVTLTMTSVDNPTVSLSQNISVLNPIPILTSATPLNFNPGPPSTTIVLSGSDFINGAQVLMNGSAVPTTFNSGTQLTATVSPTEPGTLDLQVLNPSPGPATSADLIGTVNGTPPVPIVSPQDAARFLNQATFGATDADIHHLSLIGYQGWLGEQFATQQTFMTPGVEQALIVNGQPACASGDVNCYAALLQNNQGQVYTENAFWQQSLTAPDQLRQRVAYSLHEMLVISMTSTGVMNMPRGAAHYYDVLGRDAFGNFRQLLEDVTLNPMMGQWLAMQGNDKGNANTDPDENYAREVMQLFTIGLYQLNDDGSQKLDGTGKPIPTYSNTDVQGLAKVFTGFSWNVPGNTSDAAWSDCCIYVGPGYGEDLLPMQSYPTHHSTAEKDFLGVTISAGSGDPNADLKVALDTLFNHPNLPAFFSKQMIQHLVTSNPSPAYVSRVAAVFKDNGLGVRGDLKAVITAILMDAEARDTAVDASNPQFGKVREALLRYTHWARAFTAQSRTGGYWIGSTEDPIWGLGQMTLRSPTVFNWFAPGYVPPGTSIAQAGLTGPELQMTNVSSVVGYLNYMQTTVGSDATNGFDIFSSYAAEMNLANNPGALVDRVNLLLMSGQMDSTLYGQILSAVSAIPIPTGDQNAVNAALGARVRTAVFLTLASPSYCAQY